MYEQLVQAITQFYPQDQSKGIFLTSMNGTAVLDSGGVLITDRKRPEVLWKLYKKAQTLATADITVLICDVVIAIEEVKEYSLLKDMNHEKVWLALIASQGVQVGVLLPGTKGIQNLSQWLTYMKQKYNLQWMVSVFTFTTDRKVVINNTSKK